ncbi:MAG TPA: alpha/beta hydrolase-fold protein [Agriterribacter sp.]|nr:alpha/beta hydrolase-fold protein [Agriterribacter sp.]
MTITKLSPIWKLIILFLGVNNYNYSQTQIIGRVTDTTQSPLAYVNIGIKKKGIGTVSKEDGSFTINIPPEFQNDSLTFSIVGYYEVSLLIEELGSREEVTIRLKEKVIPLKEVVVAGKKPTEKKYGIKRRGAIHFTDGIFKKDDSFEIGQVINPGNALVQITSLHLHINSSRPDSANFRINFYRYDTDENVPRQRIIEKNIVQRHPIKEGWLKFDLSGDNIWVKGNVLAAIEFIPEHKEDAKQILYEVKLGGSSKSFFRKSSLGQWTRPPHHYCLYATALTGKNAPDEIDDEETLPSFSLKSDFSTEPFSFFVRLPKNYSKNKKQIYPVIYLLDGNAYFDPIANSVERLVKKKKISTDPIIVAIGYENAYVMDSLRNRDYTFPIAFPEDSFITSGQGDKFYDFIKSKVINYIDLNYRTDTTNRTIMGHSLGGYFVLYALHRQMTASLTFKNFVAASPSIYYHDDYIIKEMKSEASNKQASNEISVYMTIGELEMEGNESNNFTGLSKIIKANGVNIQSETYKNAEHMGTAIPTFENGIQFLFHREKTD